MGKRRRTHEKPGQSKLLLRLILRTVGGGVLAVGAVILAYAVFSETSSEDSSGWLAIAMIAGFVGAAIVISIAITNPGHRTVFASTIVIVVAALATLGMILLMPEPSLNAFISHRSALAAFAFAIGGVGAALIILGEFITDNKVPPPTMRLPRSITTLTVFASIAAVTAGGIAAVPGVRAWTDDANSDVVARDNRPVPGAWTLDTIVGTGQATSALGTSTGLLVSDDPSGDPSLSVTMRDPITGDELWHHRRFNRHTTQQPMTSTDGSLIALAAQRRDDPQANLVTVLDATTGRQLADVPVAAEPGDLVAVNEQLVLHITGPEDTVLTARNYKGTVVWRIDPPTNCRITAARDAGDAILVADSCREDGATKDKATLSAVDATTGKPRWTFASKEEGIIGAAGIAVTPTTVILDVRHDTSTSEGLFAARRYRHYLTALSMTDGAVTWHRAETKLGATYAPACAGTLRLSGVPATAWNGTEATTVSSPKLVDNSIGDGLVILGECHQSGNATARFDVVGYRITDGKPVVSGGAPLGYAPQRGHDTHGWFAGLPDGRAIIVVNASIDRNAPDCRMYSVGPKEEHDRLPVPDGLDGTAWCQEASIHVTGNSIAVTHSGDGGQYFTIE